MGPALGVEVGAELGVLLMRGKTGAEAVTDHSHSGPHWDQHLEQSSARC
jgi:hypothetical protein